MRRPPPPSTLFPYTTLFRSLQELFQVRAVHHLFLDQELGQGLEGGAAVAQDLADLVGGLVEDAPHLQVDLAQGLLDRKSTRLNSSHRCISYAVFCLKKKRNI